MSLPILGMITSVWDKMLNADEQTKQFRRQKELMSTQNQYQLGMIEHTGPRAMVERYKQVGLNPGMMYGMGGGGGMTTGNMPNASPSTQQWRPNMAEAAMLGAQLEQTQAQTDLITAQADKLRGVDTENVKQDTELKKMSTIIADYTGKEAKDVYEIIKQPNRAVEEETYWSELTQRKEIADVLWEHYKSGNALDKLNADSRKAMEDALTAEIGKRQASKTLEILNENLKGKKFENVIAEIEAKVAGATGLNRDTFVKIVMLLLTKAIKQR